MPNLHAAVIFDSRHGTTARIAEALLRGLRKVSGLSAEIDFAPDVRSDVLERSDLIVVGGPTEFFSASHHMKDFFGVIGAYDLHGKFGFAFDTHAARPLSGHASRFIQRHMEQLGVTFLESPASALVENGGDGSPNLRIHLEPGAETRFETVGEKLGHELMDAVAARRKRPGSPSGEPGWSD